VRVVIDIQRHDLARPSDLLDVSVVIEEGGDWISVDGRGRRGDTAMGQHGAGRVSRRGNRAKNPGGGGERAPGRGYGQRRDDLGMVVVTLPLVQFPRRGFPGRRPGGYAFRNRVERRRWYDDDR
jgi:hypothetical protein